MNLNDLVEDEHTSDIVITEEMKTYLIPAAKWARFIAIVAVLVVCFIPFMVVCNKGVTDPPLPVGLFPIFMVIVYLLFSTLTFFPFYYLYKFSSHLLIGIKDGDEMAMVVSFKSLKVFFNIFGVLLIIVSTYYALIFLFAIFGGIAQIFW